MLILVSFLSPTQADDHAIPSAAKAVFQAFVNAFLKEDHKGVAKTFPESEKVRIDIDERGGEYSKDQAAVLMQRYFEKVLPRKLELQDGKYRGNAENPIAQYDYEYIDEKSGKKQTAVLLLSCQKISGKWVIKGVSRYDKQE
ncbi:MAG: DUF4783 domain-containing protein [Planctomycetes bacterium]|nr:DUF4783 domain-containing protein [Planctomycetota bacterium]